MAESTQRIRALRTFSYALDGVRLTVIAPGEEVSLRAGAAAGLVAERYAEAVADDAPLRQQQARRRAPTCDPA